MKKNFLFFVLSHLLVVGDLLSQEIQIPLSGKFVTTENVSPSRFKTEQRIYPGGYSTKDSVGGKYLFYTPTFMYYEQYNKVFPQKKENWGDTTMVACVDKKPTPQNMLPADHIEDFATTDQFDHRGRLKPQLSMPNTFILYTVKTSTNQYMDELFYWHENCWISIMPGPLPQGNIRIDASGIVHLYGKIDKILFSYYLVWHNNCLLWKREAPNDDEYTRISLKYERKK